MATRNNYHDAITLTKLATFDLDDWSIQELAAFDAWMFPCGKWNGHIEPWPGRKNRKEILPLACLLAALLAKENNKP